MQGSIPYVPYLRAPYYVWVGHVPQLATVMTENKVEAPPMFPPTFLYTMSWEDPRPDMEVRNVHNSGFQPCQEHSICDIEPEYANCLVLGCRC